MLIYALILVLPRGLINNPDVAGEYGGRREAEGQSIFVYPPCWAEFSKNI